MERQADIESMLHDEQSDSPVIIHDLTIKTQIMNGFKLVKLMVADKILFMKPTTFKYLFDLKDCISCMYNMFLHDICIVNAKFTNFVKVLRTKKIDDMEQAKVAICDSEYFDGEEIIDCELLACTLNDIIKNANTSPTK